MLDGNRGLSPISMLDGNRGLSPISSLFPRNGIEPAAWLKDTLEKLPVWSMRRIDELLPIKSAA